MKFKLNGNLSSALALLCLGSVVLGACGEQQAAPAAATAPPEVGVLEIRAETLALSTELPGRTVPYLVAEVRPQVGGIVERRLFAEGSLVKAGQSLYQIAAATYQASYDSARASLAKVEANLETTRNKAARYEELVAIKAVSRQDYDDSQAALKQAQADVAMARAALETARVNLVYTQVASPITGRIGRSTVTPGALVTASQETALATVQQLDPIYVDVTQSSADLLRLKQEFASGRLQRSGDSQARVRLVLEDGSTYAEAGKLQFSDVTVDKGTGTITLRAVFPNPQGQLLPGMYVRALLEEGVDAQAILAPQRAVSRDTKGNPTALVVDAQGRVEQRTLSTRRVVGERWLIGDGLKAGDRLIVDGLQKIAPGMPVSAVPLAASAATVPPAAAAAAQR